MTDKQKMQASGDGKQAGKGREIDGQMASGGQSGGEAYPNDAPKGEFDGGQSAKAHHGGGDLGEETAEGAGTD